MSAMFEYLQGFTQNGAVNISEWQGCERRMVVTQSLYIHWRAENHLRIQNFPVNMAGEFTGVP